MIVIDNLDVHGWEAAIRGMRNPKNSWDKSDSFQTLNFNEDNESFYDFSIGENDYRLMRQLANAGDDHGKFLRMINVTCDIVAPFYWWKEFDTYKVGTVADSCSTMHKIHAKEFTFDDFSREHLMADASCALGGVIEQLNIDRNMFLETRDKKYWWQMIQLLPSSYNQKRTVQMNYQVLKHMYRARLFHKLDEWREFCDWITTLPYSELITGEM